MYYYIRNRFHVHRSKFSAVVPFAYMMYAGLLVFAFITLTFQKRDKIKKLAFIFWPAKDALINNFRATPAYILERLKSNIEKYPKALNNLIVHPPRTLQQFEKA